jgi:TPR repeat protein
VGLLYETGTTVPRDPTKALAFFTQACAAKVEAACEKAKRLKR